MSWATFYSLFVSLHNPRGSIRAESLKHRDYCMSYVIEEEASFLHIHVHHSMSPVFNNIFCAKGWNIEMWIVPRLSYFRQNFYHWQL